MTDNQVRIFNFKDQNVRTVVVNHEPWFVGKDVAEILGYTNHRKALIDHVDTADKYTLKEIIEQSELCQYQNVTDTKKISFQSKIDYRSTVINESGLYALILGSKLPTAKQFKHWITSVVLPSIRKTGSYVMGEENMNQAEMLRSFMESVQRKMDLMREEFHENFEAVRPKIESYNHFLDTSTTYSLRDSATMLNVHPAHLNYWLEYGVKWAYRKSNLNHEKMSSLYPREPYKRRKDNPRGYFELKPIGRFEPQTRVTTLGLATMRELLQNLNLSQWVEEQKTSMSNQLKLFENEELVGK